MVVSLVERDERKGDATLTRRKSANLSNGKAAFDNIRLLLRLRRARVALERAMHVIFGDYELITRRGEIICHYRR